MSTELYEATEKIIAAMQQESAGICDLAAVISSTLHRIETRIAEHSVATEKPKTVVARHVCLASDVKSVGEKNCTFTSFKASGKYYTEGRGIWTPQMQDAGSGVDCRRLILVHNGGNMPGLAGKGEGFFVVVMPDETPDNFYPVLLPKLGDK